MENRMGKLVKIKFNNDKETQGTVVWESKEYISLVNNKTNNVNDLKKKEIKSIEILK